MFYSFIKESSLKIRTSIKYFFCIAAVKLQSDYCPYCKSTHIVQRCPARAQIYSHEFNVFVWISLLKYDVWPIKPGRENRLHLLPVVFNVDWESSEVSYPLYPLQPYTLCFPQIDTLPFTWGLLFAYGFIQKDNVWLNSPQTLKACKSIYTVKPVTFVY